MKLKIILLLIIIFNTNKFSAQDNYFVGFFAEKMNLSTPVGHAFIGIGNGVPLTCDIYGNETEMFGFYPEVRLEGGKSIYAGPVNGKIKNDVMTKIDNYHYKKIDFPNYLKVKLKIEEWKKKKYELTKQDCISFFIDVGELFPDLIIPDRTKFTTPDEYVKDFITVNKI